MVLGWAGTNFGRQVTRHLVHLSRASCGEVAGGNGEVDVAHLRSGRAVLSQRGSDWIHQESASGITALLHDQNQGSHRQSQTHLELGIRRWSDCHGRVPKEWFVQVACQPFEAIDQGTRRLFAPNCGNYFGFTIGYTSGYQWDYAGKKPPGLRDFRVQGQTTKAQPATVSPNKSILLRITIINTTS